MTGPRKGYLNRVRGRRLQDLIDTACVQYQRKGLANINPVPVPYKRVRSFQGKLWIGVYSGKSTVDYVGITRGGRALAFDAKMTELATRVDLGETHFPEHQREFLRWYKAAGHLAFLIVEFVSLGEIYRVPIEPVLVHLDDGNASVPLSLVRACGQLLGTGRGVVLDLLQGIV